MSIEALMNQSVTLRTPDGDSRDDIGGATITFTTLATTMYLEPTSGKEDKAGRNTQMGQWLGVGRKEIDFDSWDQIIYGDHTFDIVSPSKPFYDPITHALHHYEMDLEEVE